MKTKFIFPFLFLYAGTLACLTAQNNFDIQFRLGINQSDLSTGIDAIEPVLPRDDYPVFLIGNSDGTGFFFGVEVDYLLTEQLTVIGTVDYSRLNGNASIGVFEEFVGGTAPPIRPIREDTPILIAGTLNHDYINIGLGIRHFLMNKNRKGLFLGGGFNYLIHANTNWDLEVKYEDLSIGEDQEINDLSEEQNYQDLIFLGLEAGYAFSIKDKIQFSPIVRFDYGLNTVVENEEAPNPTVLNLGLLVKF